MACQLRIDRMINSCIEQFEYDLKNCPALACTRLLDGYLTGLYEAGAISHEKLKQTNERTMQLRREAVRESRRKRAAFENPTTLTLQHQG